ncbi:MAG: nucleotide exchange factor GrpE [Halanaerobiales bacterium]|nr:nucleotide exchange factor GrpE [Halanaerobiales bacterium]
MEKKITEELNETTGTELELELEQKDLKQENEAGESAEEQQATKVSKELAELTEKMKELEEENNCNFSKLQRLQADFINFRNRSVKEREKIRFLTIKEIMAGLLPIIDNFERALTSHQEENELKKGVDMIYRQLMKFLEKLGVEVIPAVGQPFDHNLHEALMQEEDEQYESGMIIEELEKGYILNDNVIRPAKVKVAH